MFVAPARMLLSEWLMPENDFPDVVEVALFQACLPLFSEMPHSLQPGIFTHYQASVDRVPV